MEWDIDTPTNRGSKKPTRENLSQHSPNKISGGVTSSRFISPLMLRIMVVNMVALLILVIGLLYLNQFRDNLVSERIETLKIQATIIAGALGESAIKGPESSEVELEASQQILSRLVGPTNNRARLFVTSGALLVDSQYISNDTAVFEEPLPAQRENSSMSDKALDIIDSVLSKVTPPHDYPVYIEQAGLRADDYIEVMAALDGETAVQVRQVEGGSHLVNVAVPVARFRRVLGALLLTSNLSDIEDIVRNEQITTLKIFTGGLAITLLLSFFLGRTIARPIRKLARAAERVRRAIGREENIPLFAERNDEIGDLSRSLSDMTRALYNQIDAIETFAADVAHELKNPLCSMRSAIETLNRTDREDLRVKLLDILNDDVKRLDRLITDISDASRLDAELARSSLDEIDLGVMVSTICQAYQTSGASRKIEIVYDQVEAGVYMVKGLDRRLGQVLRNLLDNALSFSPKGGVISLSLVKSGQNVICSVMDEGPGMPEGAEEKIFSRFYSERPENEDFGTHSGLGLAICKQIIEAHSGTIKAKNRVDDHSGAIFVVKMPTSGR